MESIYSYLKQANKNLIHEALATYQDLLMKYPTNWKPEVIFPSLPSKAATPLISKDSFFSNKTTITATQINFTS